MPLRNIKKKRQPTLIKRFNWRLWQSHGIGETEGSEVMRHKVIPGRGNFHSERENTEMSSKLKLVENPTEGTWSIWELKSQRLAKLRNENRMQIIRNCILIRINP